MEKKKFNDIKFNIKINKSFFKKFMLSDPIKILTTLYRNWNIEMKKR
jgi:hypothetical protein